MTASLVFRNSQNSGEQETNTDLNQPMTQAESQPVYFVRTGTRSGYQTITVGLENLQRGNRIVCRTARGLEIGDILCETHADLDAEHGRWVRNAGPEDELLWNKLLELSQSASDACQRYLSDSGLPDVLLEVEPLMDGKTLFFHFLGEPTDATNQCVEQLAEVYQEQVSNSGFAKLLEHGCGPGCGTEAKSGCGSSGGCASCGLAKKCKTGSDPN